MCLQSNLWNKHSRGLSKAVQISGSSNKVQAYMQYVTFGKWSTISGWKPFYHFPLPLKSRSKQRTQAFLRCSPTPFETFQQTQSTTSRRAVIPYNPWFVQITTPIHIYSHITKPHIRLPSSTNPEHFCWYSTSFFFANAIPCPPAASPSSLRRRRPQNSLSVAAKKMTFGKPEGVTHARESRDNSTVRDNIDDENFIITQKNDRWQRNKQIFKKGNLLKIRQKKKLINQRYEREVEKKKFRILPRRCKRQPIHVSQRIGRQVNGERHSLFSCVCTHTYTRTYMRTWKKK